MSGKLARCLWYSANRSVMGWGPHPAWAAHQELTNGFLGISSEGKGGPGPPSPARPGSGARVTFTHKAKKRPGSPCLLFPQASPQSPASCASSAPGASATWLHPGSSTWSCSAPGCAAAWSWHLHVLPPTPGAQSQWLPEGPTVVSALGCREGRAPKRHTTRPLPTRGTLWTALLAFFGF